MNRLDVYDPSLNRLGIYDPYFHLAHELGMHLHEVMGWPGPVTHVQFLAWQDWLVRQLEVPDRSDLYAMQVAERVHSLKYEPVPLDKFRIRLQRPMDPEDSPVPLWTKDSIGRARGAIAMAEARRMLGGN